MAIKIEVNRVLLPVKISYFTLFAAIGALLPYIGVYMQQLGLSPGEMAVIFSLSTITTGLVRAVVGMAADRYHQHVAILMGCSLLTGILHLCLMFVPSQSTHRPNTQLAQFTNYSCVSTSGGKFDLCMDFLQSDKFHPTENRSIFLGNDFASSVLCELQCCAHEPSNMKLVESNVTSSLFEEEGCFSRPLKNSGSKNNVQRLNDVCIMFDQIETYDACENFAKRLCNFTCSSNSSSSDRIPPDRESEKSVSKFGKTFWIFFIVYLAACCSFGPTISIIDGFAYACLGENRAKFGHQRYWGSIGFGLFGVLSGMLMDLLQENDEKNYMYSFIMFLILLIATAATARFFHATVETVSGSMLSNVCQLLRKFELNVLLLTAFVSGYLCGAQEGYLYWYIKILGGRQIVMGFIGTIQCSIEILVLFFSGIVVMKIGAFVCLCAVFAAFSVRFLLYSFLVNPWCVLSIEPLHSICYGLFYPAITIRASELTPPGMHATVQSFIGTAYMSIGRAVGVAVAGVIMEHSGPKAMWRAFSGTSLGYMFVLLLYLVIQRRFVARGAPPADVKDDCALAENAEANGLKDDRAEEMDRETPTTVEAMTPLDMKQIDDEGTQCKSDPDELINNASSSVEATSLLHDNVNA